MRISGTVRDSLSCKALGYAWVVYHMGDVTQSSAMPSHQWTWSHVNAATGQVSVATGYAGIINADWNVSDTQGGGVSSLCVALTRVCS